MRSKEIIQQITNLNTQIDRLNKNIESLINILSENFPQIVELIKQPEVLTFVLDLFKSAFSNNETSSEIKSPNINKN